MLAVLKQLINDEKGQGMAEYALVLAAVAMFAATAVGGLGLAIRNAILNIVASLV